MSGLSAVILSWLVVVSPAGLPQKPEAGADAIRSFLKALSAGDFKAAAKHVVGGKTTPQLDAFAQGIKSRGGLPIKITGMKVRAVPGTKVERLIATVTTQSTMGSKPETQTEEVQLAWSGAAYLIVPPTKGSMEDRKKPVNSMAVLFSEGMGQIFADAKENAKRTMSLSNVKQLTLATIMLAADRNDVVATTVPGWHKAIFPYCKNELIFKAPGAKGAGDSYALNPNMAKKSLNKVRKPDQTVLVYQGKNGKLDFAHMGKAAVGFCDGHCRFFDREAAKSLIWKP